MSFFIEKEVECNFNFDYEKVAEAVVSASLEHESFPYEAEVNLTLTDNEGIHAINKEYRQIDRPTDVLSFPMLSYETPGDFSFLSDENEDDFNPDTGEVMLGDIIISEQMKHAVCNQKGKLSFFAVSVFYGLLLYFVDGYDNVT